MDALNALNVSLTSFVAAAIFAIAILHTFLVKHFENLAHRYPAHAGLWHLLAEVEVVFGFWAFVLVVFLFLAQGREVTQAQLHRLNFTEPLFVFVIMVITASRPVVQAAQALVFGISRALPLPGVLGSAWVTLALVPLLGAVITEPAAMTLAALILSRTLLCKAIPERLKYAVLGVLFVNISVGGTLTPFAAPPVLMVAQKWGWDAAFMLEHFAMPATAIVLTNATALCAVFFKILQALPQPTTPTTATNQVPATPWFLTLLHVLFLIGVVLWSHEPVLFIGLFLLFLGVSHAYDQYQDRLILREAMLVAFFLAGLVVLGSYQAWWLKPFLMRMSIQEVYVGATLLTAFTDNAALTYLGTLVEGLSPSFRYALVAGAVAGGGLTLIANAPNPAGAAILRTHFDNAVISPWDLLKAAFLPTLVAVIAFQVL